MTDAPVIIDFESVCFSYGGPTVLEDVTLQVRERDFACIVGPNGGGKTTLLRLVLGLEQPTRGRVRVFGKPAADVCQLVGYMPQHAEFDPQFPVDVMDVVLMGRLGKGRRLGWYGKRDRETARRVLNEVGIDELRRRPFATLSGGQRQRVLVARALASEPRLLVLDEPITHLDPAAEHGLYELLRELNQRLTVVMVSHDLQVVSPAARSVICVNRTVAVHPTSEFDDEHIEELYGRPVRMVRHDLS